MNSLYYILPIVGLVVVLFLFWRRSKPKLVARQYPVLGMWDLASTEGREFRDTPMGQMLWFKTLGETHHAGDLEMAMDRAYKRILSDMPMPWVNARTPQSYMAMIVSETYPASNGAPSLKVTPVPTNLKGTIYDKGGFLLAGGVTFLPPQFRPALMVIPNMTSVQHIDAIENGFKYEMEHVCVFANDPERHAGLAWFEQHPFLPLRDGLAEVLKTMVKSPDHLIMEEVNGVWVAVEESDGLIARDNPKVVIHLRS